MTIEQIALTLTKQELRVAAYIAARATPTQIAAALQVERKTIYDYEHRIKKKLGVGSRRELIERLRPLQV